ncbi:cytochrome P450 9e2-like, partial [Rhipicephalus sanguineus]|uniref:cytochrome P450 9e2-like n=1 Tax=Rhipicephalus sanguineus TaxID=34632 RepID=UPI001893BC87
IQRAADSDYVLSHTGVKVKKGDAIAIPIYSMHHDPQYFSNPSVFDPERFNDENAASIKPYTYLPFGAGPRNCIGMRFALQAVKLSVLHTIRNVCLVRTAKTKVPLEFHRSAFLTAKDIIVGIRRRDDQDSQVF